ncbi:hypothetical protein PT282_00590 [Bifidobacterium sp. ESL0763]|uniref:hypothetical protein n=1 Tax=Bifidobacterium sp. ESL0763 TaxID=2983227 RepID=UPI0023F837AA|nr:hypothetical protein [Bifidobacterium sp. ESL0763]MDF7663180.1 hypothetical protein [Bifidobacterium sp. ESL0763]
MSATMTAGDSGATIRIVAGEGVGDGIAGTFGTGMNRQGINETEADGIADHTSARPRPR